MKNKAKKKAPEREINVKVTVYTHGRKRIIKSMVDTGNTLTTPAAISKEFHQKLGIGFKTLKRKSIGTAKVGSEMSSMGISNPIAIKIDGLTAKYEICPKVVDGLHTDLNIGNILLKKIGATLDFSMEKTILRVGDESTEMIQSIKTDQDDIKIGPKEQRKSRGKTNKEKKRGREKSSGIIHVLTATKDMKCKKDTLTFLPINKQRGMIRVFPLDENELCQPVKALYEGTSRIAMLNLGEKSVRFKKGEMIAAFSFVKVDTAGNREERIGEIRMESSIPPGSPEEEERVKFLWKELKLDQNKILKGRPDQAKRVHEILRTHWKVFSNESKLIGETDLMEFEVELEPGAKPHRGKIRPLNPKMKQSLKEQIDLWVKEGVAEECVSPWASPMVPVAKPNGGTRWCVDYRQLNSVTVADSYPLPSISENIERLEGGKIFSTLDATGAYHTIPVEKESRRALAFITPQGLYTFARMPFGARNAGACYSRFVQLCLDKLRSQHTMAYLDDIIMFKKNVEEHVEELRRVLEMHQQAGIKLCPGKTYLFQEEVDYLGFRVGAEGIKMKESYVEKIVNWPSPKSTKELRSVLGFMGYYRLFIKKYASLTNEMNAQRSAKKFEWTEVMETKFKELKAAFLEYPIRSYPRYDIPDKFQLTTDWSKENIAAILSQVQDGSERLIAVFGRKCTKGEANYPPWKGELSAVMYGLRKAEHILRYRPFIINTDAKALVYLKTLKTVNGILQRWLQELQTFNFEVVHRKGVDNGNADGVSRSSHLPEPEPGEEIEEGMIANIQDEINRNLDREILITAQKEDPDLMEVRKWVNGAKPTPEEMKDFGEDLKTYAQQEIKEEPDGLLVRHVTSNKPSGFLGDTILVPQVFRDSVFFWSHKHVSAGHFGMQPTILRAQAKWWYPGMVSELRRKVKTCSACLAKARVKNKDCVHKPRRSGFPGERLNIDLVGPLPESIHGNKYILTIEDAFSRWCQAIPIRNKEAKHVADALIERHVCIFGCPLEILSDQGGEFVNRTWEELCKRLEINKKTTPPYNPNSNPVERFHRTLNAILRTFLDREDPSWEYYLPMATLAYNSKVHSATGQTPFLVWMGREARLPLDIIIPTPNQRFETVEEHVQDTLRRFHFMFRQIKEQNEAIFRRNARLYSGNRHQDYKVGDRVFYYTGRKVKGKPQKITFSWLGPYRLEKKISDVLWVLTPADQEGNDVTVHVTRIRPFYGPRETGRERLPEAKQVEDLGDELAEELTRPIQWILPRDEVYNIPVKQGVPQEIIRDLLKQKYKPVTRDAAAQSTGTSESGTAAGQKSTGTKRRHKTTPVKRVRAEDTSDDDLDRVEKRVHTRSPSTEISPAEPGPSYLGGGEKRKSEVELVEARKEPKVQGEKRMDSGSDQNETNHFLKKMKTLLEPSSEGSSTQDSADEVLALGKGKEMKTTTDTQVRAAERLTLQPGQETNLRLKLGGEIPQDCWVMIAARPALTRKRIVVDNLMVPTGYNGNIWAVIRNEGNREIRIEKGQRVAQCMFMPGKGEERLYLRDGQKFTN